MAKERSNKQAGKATQDLVIRLIVWGAVIAVVVLGIVELLPRRAYSSTLADLQVAFKEHKEADEDLTLEDVEKLLKGNPEESKEEMYLKTVVKYEWEALISSYSIQVDVEKPSGRVLAYSTGGAAEEDEAAE